MDRFSVDYFDLDNWVLVHVDNSEDISIDYWMFKDDVKKVEDCVNMKSLLYKTNKHSQLSPTKEKILLNKKLKSHQRREVMINPYSKAKKYDRNYLNDIPFYFFNNDEKVWDILPDTIKKLQF